LSNEVLKGEEDAVVQASVTKSQFHQHAYAQLLRAMVQKAKKISQVVSIFLRFCGLRT